MKEEDDKFGKYLLDYIKAAEREYEELGNKKNEITKKMENLREEINNLRKTLQYHVDKTGKVISEMIRFSNVKNLAEACAILLKEEQRAMTKEQIIDKLQKGGFKFTTNKPGRSIFLAVYKNPNIQKTKKGNYKWVGTKGDEENK